MEQILATPTVNLTTTHIESRALEPTSQLDLPATFFVDSEGLADVLGLAPPPFFTVTGKIYAKCLAKFDVRLEDGQGFVRKGDTHFCFLVPERAFEDQVVLREAIEIGLVSKRLAACLLMVDPWNPVFSDRRRALLRHVPATARIANGKSSFSTDMARAILAAAETADPSAPEARVRQALGGGRGVPRRVQQDPPPLLRQRRGAAEDASGIRRLLQARRGAPAGVQGEDADRRVPAAAAADEHHSEREKDATRRHRGGGLTMPKLASFSTPARLPDPNAGAWSERVARMLAPYLDGSLPQFYDPTQRNTPAGTPRADGLVGRVPRGPARDEPSQLERWKLADGSRDLQDEYCEWSVDAQRRPQDHARDLHDRAAGVLGAPVRDRTRPGAEALPQARRPGGEARPTCATRTGATSAENRWNTSRPGRLVH